MVLSWRHQALTPKSHIAELWKMCGGPLCQLRGSVWPLQIAVTAASRIRTYMGRSHLISSDTPQPLSHRSIFLLGQLNDGPASRAPVLFRNNQEQASVASGVSVMPRQHRLGWMLLGHPLACHL